jgi:hypothetical protein
MVTSCLNPLLDRLVGPKWLDLVGPSKQTGKRDLLGLYGFDHRKLLSNLCEIYVYLYRHEPTRAIKLVAEDER